MSASSSISSLILSTADDVLRDLYKRSEYGSVILPFVVMRRLDCVLEPKKDLAYELFEKYKVKLVNPEPVILKQVNLPFFNSSKFDLGRLGSDPKNILINFSNYIEGFSNNVSDILENFKIDAIIQKLQKEDRLYELIRKFTEIDLNPQKVDNHMMGSVYEELLRKFSEMSNETSGEHFTPRDVVKLLVKLVFGGDRENLSGVGKIRSVFDPCCGTGGMLTIGKEWVQEHINAEIKMNLFGQELNDETYAICKSDFLMLNEDPDNIYGPHSSLSKDKYSETKFDYMITNPPYGVSWKSEKGFILKESKDPNGRFNAGVPTVKDGQMLFLQHLISKMSPEGSRIGIVLNGSPLFTGDAGSGESEIRKWIIENDWLESIICLPDRMFFNTGITTYIWIISNKKSAERKGKVQLINGSTFSKPLKKNLGDKSKFVSDEQIDILFDIYRSNKDSEFCKIYNNDFFKYTRIVVEQPLKINGEVIKNKKGIIKPDSAQRDNEWIPFGVDIQEYFEKEVLPFMPESWMDRKKDKIGYEICFTKYFYKFRETREIEVIKRELQDLDKEISDLSNEVFK